MDTGIVLLILFHILFGMPTSGSLPLESGELVSSIALQPEVSSAFSLFALDGNVFYALLGVAFVFRILALVWVAKDVTARTDNVQVQVISILLVTFLTPIVGLPLYLLIRPVGYVYDQNGWRESILMQSIDCNACGQKNLLEFNFCVLCGESLKVECKECGNEYYDSYEYCYTCGAPNIGKHLGRKKHKKSK